MGKLLSIVLTDNHIRIAELSNGRRGVSVYRLLTKEVPESLVSGGLIVDVRGFAEYLNATLKYANIKTKKVVFSLPSDRIMSREVVKESEEEKAGNRQEPLEAASDGGGGTERNGTVLL